MTENKTNTGLWIAGALLLLGGGAFFYFKNKAKKDTANENKALDNLTSSDETQQAAKLKKYLSVSEVWAVGFVANPLTSNPYGCCNVCNEITNYPGVQSKFSQLCENKYTLQRAFETGLSDAQYNECLKLLKLQKVATTKEARVFILPDRQSIRSNLYKTMPAGTILGSLMESGYFWVDYDGRSESESSYMFFNGYDANNKPVYAFVAKDNAELITPK